MSDSQRFPGDSRPTVAYQGEPGAFSEAAALAYFGADAIPVPVMTFEEIGDAVRSGTTTYGILPVENSLAGPVTAAVRVLDASDLDEIGSLILPIRLCLLAISGSGLGSVTQALSHPVALGQCKRFQAENPEIQFGAWYDTAGAASYIASEGDPSLAAIASQRAAEYYGLQILRGGIEDRSDNRTRFIVIGSPDQI